MHPKARQPEASFMNARRRRFERSPTPPAWTRSASRPTGADIDYAEENVGSLHLVITAAEQAALPEEQIL